MERNIAVIFSVCVEFLVGHCLFAPFRMDATLKELTSLVKEVYPEARKKGTHFSFNIVYPDPRGKMYRLVLYNNKIRLMQREHQLWIYIDICLINLTLQIERHWQYCVWQERHR